jgi:alpha-beta hydrolase superfamily lysophospholipase
MSNTPLAALLAEQFTVFNYDRRGRGDSGDTPPYAVEREIEDIDAVIEAAGGSAFLYGTSSGAALVLATAASGLDVKKLALWEPPYIVEGSRPRPPADTAATYRKLVAEDRRGDAVEFFMTQVVGLPAEFAAQARQAPWWAWQEGLAHTLAYDAEIMGDYSLPTTSARAVTVPTLILDGGGSMAWMGTGTDALAELIPDSRRHTLGGQAHDVDPQVLAPVLIDFFRR